MKILWFAQISGFNGYRLPQAFTVDFIFVIYILSSILLTFLIDSSSLKSCEIIDSALCKQSLTKSMHNVFFVFVKPTKIDLSKNESTVNSLFDKVNFLFEQIILLQQLKKHK